MNGQITEGNAVGSPGADDSLRADLANLTRLVETVATLVRSRPSETDRPKSYTIKAAAKLRGKAEYTVRGWALDGRYHAYKVKGSRSGKYKRWRIAASEIDRIKAEDLLPPAPERNRSRSGTPEPAPADA